MIYIGFIYIGENMIYIENIIYTCSFRHPVEVLEHIPTIDKGEILY